MVERISSHAMLKSSNSRSSIDVNGIWDIVTNKKRTAEFRLQTYPTNRVLMKLD